MQNTGLEPRGAGGTLALGTREGSVSKGRGEKEMKEQLPGRNPLEIPDFRGRASLHGLGLGPWNGQGRPGTVGGDGISLMGFQVPPNRSRIP